MLSTKRIGHDHDDFSHSGFLGALLGQALKIPPDCFKSSSDILFLVTPGNLSRAPCCRGLVGIMVEAADSKPSPFNYILSFLLVGIAWGFTTPFIRRAAVKYKSPTPETHPSLFDERRSWISRKFWTVFYSIIGLLRSPSYAIPLLCNLTGSAWFFLLVGKAGKLIARCRDVQADRCRTVSHSAHHKLISVSVHCPWRVVCRWQAN